MATRTTTKVSHYHVQKERRRQFLQDWRQNRQTVIRGDDVVLTPTARRLRSGVYMGSDGDRPTRVIDAWVHEVDPHTCSTVHRHSWDALMLCVGGSGWTEVDGRRIVWGPGDAVHLPAWSWHRQGNDGERPARYLSFSSEPLLASMNLSMLEDAGDAEVADLPLAPGRAEAVAGSDPYARRLQRLGAGQRGRAEARLHTSWDELELLVTPRGTRTTFLLDPAIGYVTSGITLAMFEIGPGRGQSMHRHPGEAWLYVLDGTGHSYLGTEPEGGTDHPWRKGDLIVVDHFLWHQHFNDDPQRTARVVRIHMFHSLLETMRALCDPLVLFEEPPDHIRDAQAGDPTSVDWPAVTRPIWP